MAEHETYLVNLARGALPESVPARIRNDPAFIDKCARTVGLAAVASSARTPAGCLLALEKGVCDDARNVPEKVMKTHYKEIVDVCIRKGMSMPIPRAYFDLDTLKKMVKYDDKTCFYVDKKHELELHAYAFDKCGAPWERTCADHSALHTPDRVLKALAEGTPATDLPAQYVPLSVVADELAAGKADYRFMLHFGGVFTEAMWREAMEKGVAPVGTTPASLLTEDYVCNAIACGKCCTLADVPARLHTPRVGAAIDAHTAAEKERVDRLVTSHMNRWTKANPTANVLQQEHERTTYRAVFNTLGHFGFKMQRHTLKATPAVPAAPKTPRAPPRVRT